MADDAQSIRSLNWRELFPFINLFRAFRVAILNRSRLCLLRTVALARRYSAGFGHRVGECQSIPRHREEEDATGATTEGKEGEE